MTPIARTLVIIAAFVALMVGSFIWFVITWDAAKEPSLSHFPAFPTQKALI